MPTFPFLPVTTKKQWRVAWLLLILVPMALYAPFMNNPLVFDDQLIRNGAIDRFPEALTTRWIFLVSLWLNASLHEQQVAGFRLVNLGVHIATSGVLLVVMRQWLAIADPGNRLGKGRDFIAYAGALLFAIHPAAVYGAGYLVQRSILLSTLFALVAIGLHTRAQSERKPLLFLVAALAFALSVFSKEHSVALPAFLAVLSYWLHRNGHWWSWRWSPVFLGYAAISLFIVHLTQVAPADFYEPHTGNLGQLPNHPYLASLLTQTLFFFRYLGLWLLPLPAWLSIDLHSDMPYRVISWWSVAAVTMLLAYVMASLRMLRQATPWSLVGLCAAYSLLMFGTEFWAIRLSESFVIYRSYLWMVFVVPVGLLAAALLRQKFAPRISLRSCMAVIAIVGLAFAAVAIERLDSMSSNFKLWQDVLNKNREVISPAVARAYLNLGGEYAKLGQTDVALSFYRRTIEINPKSVGAYLNLGNHAVHEGNLTDALGYYDQAIAANPDNPVPHFVRADILLRMNRVADAMTEYQGMRRLTPKDPKVLNNIAAVRILNNEIGAAIEVLEPLVASGKAHDVSHFNLALAHVRLGDVPRARTILARAILAHPDTPLLEAFRVYLTRESIAPTRWQPRIDPRSRAPLWIPAHQAPRAAAASS